MGCGAIVPLIHLNSLKLHHNIKKVAHTLLLKKHHAWYCTKSHCTAVLFNMMPANALHLQSAFGVTLAADHKDSVI